MAAELRNAAVEKRINGRSRVQTAEYVTESGNTYTAVPGRSGKYHR